MRDPYQVLGVARTASADDIKKSYRRLAKKLHPDANKNDAGSAARFAELNSAYEIVGDEAKRKQFDRGEIDAEGKPRFQGFEAGARPGSWAHSSAGPGDAHFETFSFGPEGVRSQGGRRGAGGGGFQGFDDILSSVFGNLGGDAARRGRRPTAHGHPPEPEEGAASLTITLQEAIQGAKKRVELRDGKTVDVTIPPGIRDGQQIRLRAGGGQRADGASEVRITVAVAADPQFQIEGDDIRVQVPITLYDAVLGGKVRVPTPAGALELTIPKGTSSGRVFRLRGKGLPAKGQQGNLLAEVRVVLPPEADEELEALMHTWREQRPYEP